MPLCGNSARPKLKILSLSAPIAGMLYTATCVVQDHPSSQVPIIDWVGPDNQTMYTNGNIVIGVPVTTNTTTSRSLLFKVLTGADSGVYMCASRGAMPPFQLITLDVQGVCVLCVCMCVHVCSADDINPLYVHSWLQ